MRIIDKWDIDVKLDLNSINLFCIVIGIIESFKPESSPWIIGLAILGAFGRKGLDAWKEVALIYADKNPIK